MALPQLSQRTMRMSCHGRQSILPFPALSRNAAPLWIRFPESLNSAANWRPIRFFSRQNSCLGISLMDHPKVVPSIFSVLSTNLKNKFFEKYIQHRYDSDFSIEAFKRGAFMSLLTVSSILASDDVEPLRTEGLVDPKAFDEIKHNHGRLNEWQRRQLLVSSEEAIRSNVMSCIGIIEDEMTGLRAVEIMMSYAIIEPQDLTAITLTEAAEKPMLCNYRFYRDYSNRNNPSPWILNVVNHFNPKDLS